MQAYRMNWSPELTTFAVKSYHGHRGVPPTMDTVIDQLEAWNKRKGAARGRELVAKDLASKSCAATAPALPDLADIDPQKLAGLGLVIEKDFDGFGLCQGKIRSVDTEVGTLN